MKELIKIGLILSIILTGCEKKRNESGVYIAKITGYDFETGKPVR